MPACARLRAFATPLAATLGMLALATPSLAPAQAAPGGLHLTLDYDGRLYLKVLELKVQQDATPAGFTSTARLTTYGVLALFRKLDMRAEGHGRIDGGAAEPGSFRPLQRLEQKAPPRDRHLDRGRCDRNLQPAIPRAWATRPPARLQRLEAADPLTVAMRIAMTPARRRSLPWRAQVLRTASSATTPCSRLDGSRELEGREKRLGLTAPVKCRLQYREVAGFKKKPVRPSRARA